MPHRFARVPACRPMRVAVAVLLRGEALELPLLALTRHAALFERARHGDHEGVLLCSCHALPPPPPGLLARPRDLVRQDRDEVLAHLERIDLAESLKDRGEALAEHEGRRQPLS